MNTSNMSHPSHHFRQNLRCAAIVFFVLAVIALVLMCSACTANAQDTPPASQPTASLLDAAKVAYDGAKHFLDGNTNHSSNWLAAPYATYFPNTKGADKFGGGLFIAYKANNYVSVGLGLDYLGQLWMPSGNVNLKYDIHPLSRFGLPNFVATPFALAGVAVPLSGAGKSNGGAALLTGFGVSTKLGRIKGGDLDIGYAAVKWRDAGIYSGTHHELFLAWKKTF